MPGLSKVIVLDPDARAARQVLLGFQREGIPAAVGEPAAATGSRAPVPEDVGLVVVGGVDGGALDLVRHARRMLGEAHIDAPIVFAGRGVRRTDAEAAGADEVVLQPVHLRDVVTIGRLLLGVPAGKRARLVGNLLETTGVFTLVRALAALGRSAVLTMIRGLRRGEVRFFHGEVTSAQVGLIHGQAALHQLLLWTDARFDFYREDVVRRQQIPMSHAELFADAEQFLAGVRQSSGALSPAMVLEQDIARVQALGRQIPTEVHGVLRMFDGHRVLADVLEDSPYRVFETLRVTQRAVEVGLLRIAASSGPRSTWRAVLAIEEWLVGSTARVPAAPDAGPLAPNRDERAALDSVARGKGGARRKRKKKRANTPIAVVPVVGGKQDIDWGSLVPRVVGAEVGPLAGVVPAAHTSGEIVLPREGLEGLTDARERDRLFATGGGEPTVVWDEHAELERTARVVADTEESEPIKAVRGVDPERTTPMVVAVEAPSAESEAAESEAAESEAAESEAVESATAESATTESAATESATAEFAAAESEAAESATAESATAESATAESDSAESATTESEAAESATVESATAESAAAESATAESAAAESETAESATAESATAESEAAVPEPAAAESATTTESVAEPAAAEPAAAEPAAPESVSSEPATDETAAADSVVAAAADTADTDSEKVVATIGTDATEPVVAAPAAPTVPVDRVETLPMPNEMMRELLANERSNTPPMPNDVVHQLLEQERAQREPSSGVPEVTVIVSDTFATAIALAAPAPAPAEATPTEVVDEMSDGVIRDRLHAADTAPVQRRPPPGEIPEDDRPDDATGEITMPRLRDPPVRSAQPEPSILVADLGAVHSAVSAIAEAQAAAPRTADAQNPRHNSQVIEVIKDAAAAFTDVEEAFFKAGHGRHGDPDHETFSDLDEGYQPVGFWDRLLGRKAGPKAGKR